MKNFCLELTAVQTAKILRVNRHTVDRYYQLFRERIAEYEEKNLKQLSGNIKIDESYFGSRHVGDKRGRGAKWRIPVIGILKRNGLVYATIIPDVSRKTLMPIIEKLVKKSQSNIYTESVEKL